MGFRMLIALAIVCVCTLARADDEAWPNKPGPGLTVQGHVVEVHDGDTLTVEVRTRIHVRLIDCWCPEIRTKDPDEKRAGLRAKSVAEMIALDKDCTLFIPGTGIKTLGDVTSMGRVLGHVWLEDDDDWPMSRHMISCGVASRTKPKP